MKKLKLVLLGLLVSLVVNAEDEMKQYDKITLKLVDGTSYDIPIDGNSYIYSCIENEGENNVQVIYINGDQQKYKFRRDEILSLSCIPLPAGIEYIEPEKMDNMRYEEGVFKFTGSLHGEYLSVYDISGRLIQYTQITTNSRISLEHLPQGIYVAKVNSETIKVAVR